MQKVLLILAAILPAAVLAQTAPPPAVKPPQAAPMGAGQPPMPSAPGLNNTAPGMPSNMPSSYPSGHMGSNGSIDPFKRNPVNPPPSATTTPSPEVMAPPPEPPKTPTLGAGTDGRTFVGVVGTNRALYKTGDGYVYEEINAK